MSMYRIILQPRNLSKPEKFQKVSALNAVNASEISAIYNKDCTVERCIRIGTEKSTEQVLKDLRDDMEAALHDGNQDIANRLLNSFVETVEALKGTMGIVSWNKTKDKIPKLS